MYLSIVFCCCCDEDEALSFECKKCNTVSQTHVLQANKYARQIETLITRELAHKRADDHTNIELSKTLNALSGVETLLGEVQLAYEQFDACNDVNKNICDSNTENISLIKLYECYIEMCIRAECFAKAASVAESLLSIYK